MDFLSDQLFDGRKIRMLTIIDNFTRVSPAIDVRMSYRGADVVATLERIAQAYGRPKQIRLDNGPEFISKDLDLWGWLHGIKLDFTRPGKPTDNAFAESFNGKFRAECLNAYWFRVMASGVRFGCVLADAGYGNGAAFCQGLSARGLTWAVGVPPYPEGLHDKGEPAVPQGGPRQAAPASCAE